MAAETPGVQDFSNDLVDEVAGEVVGGTTRDQMLGAFSGISSRLVKLHNGAVRMHAETEDPEILIWSGVRVVSDKEVFEKGGQTEGWGLTLEQVNKGEFWECFAVRTSLGASRPIHTN